MLIVFSALLLQIPPTAHAAGSRAVYVEAPASWGKVMCYLWNDAGAHTAWPGTEMTHVKDRIYRFDAPDEMINIIFNNAGGSQTADLVIPGENKIYRMASSSTFGTWNDYNEEASTPTEPTTPEAPKTVYFKAPQSWGSVYCYVWNSSGNLQAWPGTAMVHVSDDIYTMEVPGKFENIIFNNKTSQTANLAIPGNNFIFIPRSSSGSQITGTWYLYSIYEPPTEPVCPSTKGSTIYFEAPDDWQTPFIYSSKTDSGTPAAGTAMEKVSENIYSYTLEDDFFWFVFSDNGSQQTTFINYAGNSMIYSYADKTWSPYQSPPASDTIPILFKRPESWGDVTPYAYYWNGINVPKSWPGYDMEHFSEDFYIIDIPSEYTNIVFSNPDTHQQSIDTFITGNDNHIFIFNGGQIKSSKASQGYAYTGTWELSDRTSPPFEVYKADRYLNTTALWRDIFTLDMPYKLIDDAAASDGLYNDLTSLYQKITNNKFRGHPEYFYEIVITDIIVQKCKTSDFVSGLQSVEEDSAYTLTKILSKLIKIDASQTLNEVKLSSVDPALIKAAIQDYEDTIDLADSAKILTALKSSLNTVGDLIETLSKYSAIARISEERQAVIHRISEICTNTDMKLALSNIEQMFHSSPADQFILAFQKTADQIFWNYLEKIVTTSFSSLGILSLAKDVGVLLSDGLFATGNISETYLQIHAVTEFERLLKVVALELKSSYHDSFQEQDAALFNEATELAFDTMDYGIDLTRIYVDSVLQDNIASWVDHYFGGKNEETHKKFTSFINTCKIIVNGCQEKASLYWGDYKAQYHV